MLQALLEIEDVVVQTVVDAVDDILGEELGLSLENVGASSQAIVNHKRCMDVQSRARKSATREVLFGAEMQDRICCQQKCGRGWKTLRGQSHEVVASSARNCKLVD